MNAKENFSVAQNGLRSPFPTISSAIGIKHGRPQRLYRVPGLATPSSVGITVTNREQGQKDADRRDALRRGGL